MIDIIQWRTMIGLWYCHVIPKKTPTTDNSVWVKSLLMLVNEGGGDSLVFSLVLFLVLLLKLSGDVELNPGPKTELTSCNALRLLVKSGFVVKKNWMKLTCLLGVSLEERRRLMKMASTNQDYHFALEEGLQWWITNSTAPSWEEFISAVEYCGDEDIASVMRRQLDVKDLTSNNVLQLLVKSGFIVKDKWIGLIGDLGVSSEEVIRLKKIASSDQDYHSALEEGLQSWITNSTDPSWEKLISALENCGDKDVATTLKRQVDSTKDEERQKERISDQSGGHEVHKVLRSVLTSHFARLSDQLKPSLQQFATEMYSHNLISRSVRLSPTVHSVIDQFENTMQFIKEDISKLQKHCRIFLHCLSSEGGPMKLAAQKLCQDWIDEVKEKCDISLDLTCDDLIQQDKRQGFCEAVTNNKQKSQEAPLAKVTSQPLELKQKDNTFSVKKEAGSSLDSLENDLIRLKSNPNRTEEEDTLLLLLENELKLYKDIKSVMWSPDHTVALTLPSREECEDVMRLLKEQKEDGWQWHIILRQCMPDTSLMVLSGLNECVIKFFEMRNILLDRPCVCQLSEQLSCNTTIREIHFIYSSLPPSSLEMIMKAISVNTKLTGLVIIGDKNITDNDICHVCNVVTVNTTLEVIFISHCPHITKIAEEEMTKVLDKNKSLLKLVINDAWLISR